MRVHNAFVKLEYALTAVISSCAIAASVLYPE